MKHTHVIDRDTGEMREILPEEANRPLIYDVRVDGFVFVTQKDVDHLMKVAVNWGKTRDAMEQFHRELIGA
jgi:hypothetical protein